MMIRRFLRSGTVPIGISLFALVIASGCLSGSEPDIRSVEATIRLEGERYVLVDDSSAVRYVPERMPLPYREEGLKVYMSGRFVDTLRVNGVTEVLVEMTSLAQRRPEESSSSAN